MEGLWSRMDRMILSMYCRRHVYLVSGGVLYLGSEGLGLGLRGEQRLGFVQTEAEDLTVELIVLLPQLLALLERKEKNRKEISTRNTRASTAAMMKEKKVATQASLNPRNTTLDFRSRKHSKLVCQRL
ncbi:hypothetical protein EYF80_018789 [Liparis tanakae]|uniref:Uncharacterized protein n=1 Tax=Liparis tanakae TaxID=230148 RepID=A0A4Z2I174_9TELE|nr:hypothetical protein EYF80_018789 [Liparis tanakae]